MKKKILWALAYLLVAGSISACSTNNETINYGGKETTRTLRLPAFTGVEAGGVFDVVYREGSENTVEITTCERWMPHVKANVEGGILHLYTEGHLYSHGNVHLTAILRTPQLLTVNMSGASRFTAAQAGASNQPMSINVSGAAQVRIEEAEGSLLTVEGSGAGDMKLGTTLVDRLKANSEGAASFMMKDLRANSVSAKSSGACKLKWETVSVKQLQAEASGASSFTIKSLEANTVDANVTGASNLQFAGRCQSGTVIASGASTANCRNLAGTLNYHKSRAATIKRN